jgi:hypothetical protein
MSQHYLQGRSPDELLWFQRRSFLKAAAAWTALGGYPAAQAQGRSNIVELQGDAQVNGTRLLPQQSLQTGDEVVTGPGSNLVFVLGNSSFQVRESTRLKLERGATLYTVSILRLITGAVVSVWGKGEPRQIVTPTLTAGIRGTGVYTEVQGQQDQRTFFCNCYGTVDLVAGEDRRVSQATYHESFWAEANPQQGRCLFPTAPINHTDEELEYLARLVDQRTAWQIAGRKGMKKGQGGTGNDNSGYTSPPGG